MCKAHSNTRHGNLRLTTDSCGCASSAHSTFCVIKNSYYTKKTSYSFVGSPMPATGIEPVWEYKSRRILSPVRLPVPPHRLNGRRRIRTFEGIASRFTVCPLWPLGNPPLWAIAHVYKLYHSLKYNAIYYFINLNLTINLKISF